MSFFKKKMSQYDWATILPFGPVTLIFYWPKFFFRASQRLALISGTGSRQSMWAYTFFILVKPGQ